MSLKNISPFQLVSLESKLVIPYICSLCLSVILMCWSKRELVEGWRCEMCWLTRIISKQDKKYTKVIACLFISRGHVRGGGWIHFLINTSETSNWSLGVPWKQTIHLNESSFKINSIIFPFTNELRKPHIWSNNTCELALFIVQN